MTKKKTDEFSFEQALADLTQIVRQMEQGNLGLEESLVHFERGIVLTRECQQALQQAEQKVQILLGKAGAAELAPYQPDADET